jgi:flagellar assembly protein FliH
MSTVIKQGKDGRALQRLVTFDLADHMAEAHKIVADARNEARHIVGQAKLESQRLRAEAQERGQAEGFEKGYAEALAAGREQGLAEATERFNREHGQLAASMARVIESIEQEKQDLLIAANREVLEFAVALATKVTHRVARMDRQAALANVEQALRLVGKKTDLIVRVHPVDAETLGRFAEELADRTNDLGHLKVVEDESISPGGAVVSSGPPDAAQVDASIETQLEQITTLLLGEVRSEK